MHAPPPPPPPPYIYIYTHIYTHIYMNIFYLLEKMLCFEFDTNVLRPKKVMNAIFIPNHNRNCYATQYQKQYQEHPQIETHTEHIIRVKLIYSLLRQRGKKKFFFNIAHINWIFSLRIQYIVPTFIHIC